MGAVSACAGDKGSGRRAPTFLSQPIGWGFLVRRDGARSPSNATSTMRKKKTIQRGAKLPLFFSLLFLVPRLSVPFLSFSSSSSSAAAAAAELNLAPVDFILPLGPKL